jgi:hypothetical protein
MLTSDFKDMRPKGENVNIRSKRGKFDLGGVQGYETSYAICSEFDFGDS